MSFQFHQNQKQDQQLSQLPRYFFFFPPACLVHVQKKKTNVHFIATYCLIYCFLWFDRAIFFLFLLFIEVSTIFI